MIQHLIERKLIGGQSTQISILGPLG